MKKLLLALLLLSPSVSFASAPYEGIAMNIRTASDGQPGSILIRGPHPGQAPRFFKFERWHHEFIHSNEKGASIDVKMFDHYPPRQSSCRAMLLPEERIAGCDFTVKDVYFKVMGECVVSNAYCVAKKK